MGNTVIAARLEIVERRSGERGAQRFRLLLEAGGQIGGESVEVVIRDLSTGGLLIETDIPIQVGAEVAVELPQSGQVMADVVWHEGRLAGASFRKTITQAAVADALAQSPVIWPNFSASSWKTGDLKSAASPDEARILSRPRRMQLLFGLGLIAWVVVGVLWYFFS